jgi:TM2 domain-containing membrane protein YozV
VTSPYDSAAGPSGEPPVFPTYRPPPFDAPDPPRLDPGAPIPGYYAPDPAQAMAVPAPPPFPASGPPPYHSPNWSPDAPYGRDPATGEPLSDKNKVAAAFLQLFLGVIGAGRFYIGDARTGFIAIGLTLAAIFGSVYIAFGWILWPALAFWWVADFIYWLSGHGRDSHGRKLR